MGVMWLRDTSLIGLLYISKNVFFTGDLPEAADVAGIIRISAFNQERII